MMPLKSAWLLHPTNAPSGYFNQNMVSEYSHEMAVADGVNVGYDVFIIDTKVTQQALPLKGRIYWAPRAL